MKGGMKTARILYLKGLAPSDGRDGPLFVNTRSLFGNKAALSKLYLSFISANRSLKGNYSFPVREFQIPRQGKTKTEECTLGSVPLCT